MVPEKRRLEGKVAIITGGGTGLGKAMALALAGEGADIVVAARRVEPINQTARAVRGLGRRALAIPTDITDSRQVNSMVEQSLTQMGRIDILINNAGGSRGDPRNKQIWEITDEEWHLGIDKNLSGAFFCARAVAKHLVAQKRGKIINVASGWGLRGGRREFPRISLMYCCAKSGVIQLTRSLATTMAQDGIQANCIVPVADTSSLQPEPRLEPRTGGSETSVGMYPVGRYGIPSDAGSLALFLASDASDYITGGIFIADGGLSAACAPNGYVPVIPLKED